MSEQPTVCKVCKQPLAAHQMQLRWGTPHAGIVVDGHFRSCTELIAEYEYSCAQRWTLTTLVRSFRWNAGRLRTKRAVWTPDDLDARADKAMKQIEALERQVDLYYAWAKKES